MIRIPYGSQYSASITGWGWSLVTCKYCGGQYVFRVKVTGVGTGTTSVLWLDNKAAKESAKKAARDDLLAQLQNEFQISGNVYPCPDCGMYQVDKVDSSKPYTPKKLSFWPVFLSFLAPWVVTFLCAFWVLGNSPYFWIFLVLMCILVGFMFRDEWNKKKKESLNLIELHANRQQYDVNADANKRGGRSFSEDYPVLRRAEYEQLKKAGKAQYVIPTEEEESLRHLSDIFNRKI